MASHPYSLSAYPKWLFLLPLLRHLLRREEFRSIDQNVLARNIAEIRGR